MNQVYPERNPFPHEASLTIDGVEGQGGTAEGLRKIPLPTFPLPPVEQLRRLIERYFSQCDPLVKGTGLPVALRGDHGTGKTHTIRHVMSLVTSGELRPPTGGLQPYQLYARAETANFMEVYRQLMRQVPLAMLRDLTQRFLGVVSSEIYGESVSNDLIGERAVQRVIQDPEIVNQAFREYVVGESEAKSRQAAEIQSTVGKEENFQNVIGYLLRDDLAETAYHWLIGAEVNEAEWRKLGVSSMIETPALARWGIRFLATIFGRGGRPLIIYIDQYEKLLLGVDGAIIAENVGLMRALVEEIREANAMLIFAGNIEAWQAVSQVRDLRQRFGTNVIEFPTLSYDQARNLIGLYLSMGRSHLLEVWPLEDGSGDKIQLYGHALAIRAITVSQDRQLLISASKDSTIKSWSVESGEILKTLHGHQGAVNAVALTRDQKWLVSGGDDHTVRVWDVHNGSNLFNLVGHENWVNAVAVSPNGRHAFSGSSDLTVRVWDLQNRKEIKVLSGHRDTVWALAIAPDGKTLVSASSDNTLRVWDLSTLEPRLTLIGHTGWVNAVAITPDGRRAISASDDKTLRVWDLETGQTLNILQGHEKAVRAVEVLPDGKRVVSAAVDDTYNVWNLKRGQLLTTIHRTTGSICAFTVLPGKTVRLVSAQSEEFSESNEIYPFKSDGVQTMLRNGGGNTRRLLQMCAEAFELAFPKKRLIDEPLLEEILGKDHGITVNRRWVTKEIEKLTSERSLRFRHDYPVGDKLVDVAILAPDGAPRLLVQVSGALFFKEEADDALSSIDLIDQVRQHDLPAQVVLVVTGYASPEVTNLLRRAAHEAIVYQPDTFAARFGQVLDRLQASLSTASNVGHEIDTLKTDLHGVKQVLERIAATRGLETSNLEEQLQKLFQQQSISSAEPKLANPRLLWLQERKQIEERIRGVRKNQQRADFEELERLRKKAADERNQRRNLMTVIFGICGLIFGVLLVSYFTGLSGLLLLIDYLPTALAAGFFFMVIFAAVGAFGQQLVEPRRLRELASEVTSLEELSRLARAAVSPERETVNKDSQILRLLRSSNPHFRYAGALALNPKEHGPLLVHALGAERSTVVRRVIARRLGFGAVELDRIFQQVSFETTPELAYLVESAAASASLPAFSVPSLPSPLQTLAVIAAKPTANVQDLFKEISNPASLALVLAVSQLADVAVSTHSRESVGDEIQGVLEINENGFSPYSLALNKAFQSGLSGNLSYLRSISELQIQNALRELSPFEEGGLGTFDDLDNISKIDQYYLFFRQLAFYKEYGLLDEDE